MAVTVLDVPSNNQPSLKARETAVVIVNGKEFSNWKSVHIQSRWTDPYPEFSFTCAEQLPTPSLWTEMQFEPADEVGIILGGQHAISGVILVRQTAYDAENHGVQFQGVGVTWYPSRASHVDKDGNFDKMTFKQIVERVLAPHRDKVSARYVGNISELPFQHMQISPGEPIWQFFERLARMIGVVVGSDPYGNFVFIGDHIGEVAARLTEGVNILKCQAVIAIEKWYSEIILRNQQAGSDDTNMGAASQQEARAPGTLRQYSPLVIPSEEPVSAEMLKLRADNEAKHLAGSIINATITVQGWFVPDNSKLWTPGDLVEVDSPMALIAPVMVLAIQTVTFTQDRNQGTLTTLELVAPWLLNDRTDKNV